MLSSGCLMRLVLFQCCFFGEEVEDDDEEPPVVSRPLPPPPPLPLVVLGFRVGCWDGFVGLVVEEEEGAVVGLVLDDNTAVVVAVDCAKLLGVEEVGIGFPVFSPSLGRS